MRMMSSGVTAAMVITVGWLMASATAILHKVGGKQGWDQNVNYTEWAANEQVYVGEWLSTFIIISLSHKICVFDIFQNNSQF